MKFPSIDELFKIAKEEPDKLNEILEYETNKIIKSSSNPNKVKQLKFKIDLIKEKNGNNHLANALDISSLMWDSYIELNEKLQDFSSTIPEKEKEKENKFTLIK